jgi:hypothetical protein
MLAENLSFTGDDNRLGISSYANRAIGEGHWHAIAIALQMDQARRRDALGVLDKALSAPSVTGVDRSARGSIMCSAAIRSAWPLASVRQASTTRPLRFSINAWPETFSTAC